MFRFEPQVTVKIGIRKRSLIIKTQLEVLTNKAAVFLEDLALTHSEWNLLGG